MIRCLLLLLSVVGIFSSDSALAAPEVFPAGESIGEQPRSEQSLVELLQARGYKKTLAAQAPGEFSLREGELLLLTRAFDSYQDGSLAHTPELRVAVSTKTGTITNLLGPDISSLSLEPTALRENPQVMAFRHRAIAEAQGQFPAVREVHTGLDTGLQRCASQAFLAVRPEALVSLEPASGAILAWWNGGGEIDNVATTAFPRGSLFKPFLLYAAVASRTFTAVTSVDDGSGDRVRLSDFAADLSHPAYSEVAKKLGPEPVLDVLRKLKLVEQTNTLSPALSPLEVARVYSTLVAAGALPNVRIATSVIDGEMKRRELRGSVSSPVLDEYVSFVTTSLLAEDPSDTTVMLRATARDPETAWFLSLSPQRVTVVAGKGNGQTYEAAWARFETCANQIHPPEARRLPSGSEKVEKVEFELTTGALVTDACRGVPSVTEFFLSGTAPAEPCSPQTMERAGAEEKKATRSTTRRRPNFWRRLRNEATSIFD